VWSREDYAVERIIQRIEHLEEECMVQRIQRIYSRAEHIIQSTSSKVHPPQQSIITSSPSPHTRGTARTATCVSSRIRNRIAAAPYQAFLPSDPRLSISNRNPPPLSLPDHGRGTQNPPLRSDVTPMMHERAGHWRAKVLGMVGIPTTALMWVGD
jgi:hypothetical protein